MRRLIMLLPICCLLILLFSFNAFAQGGPCPAHITNCPVEGCGGPGSDFLLNRSKNRVTPPAVAQIINKTLTQIRNMNQPSTWSPNQNRSSIQGPGKEGQPVRVMGFLWTAKREHKEACNCGQDKPGLAGEFLTDIHMVMTDRMSDPEATSVTAEITPRVRSQRPNPITWTHSRITLLRGRFIRVTGFLMLDTQHINNPLVRATNWEVHPITKLEVCNSSITQCRAGSGWQNVP